MPEIGPEIYWRLGLKSTLQTDATQAKTTLNNIEVSGDKTTGSLNILDQATGKCNFHSGAAQNLYSAQNFILNPI